MDVLAVLQNFDRDDIWLEGRVAYGFWGGTTLPTFLGIDEDDQPEPTPYQLMVFEELLSKKDDVRPYFANTLFEHYCSRVYGSRTHYSTKRGFYGKDEITPPITSQEQVWDLISGPSVYIEDDMPETRGDDALRFELGFDCQWDPEHGLSVHFRNWKIVNLTA